MSLSSGPTSNRYILCAGSSEASGAPEELKPCDNVVHLSVEKRDGTITQVPAGTVVLAAGANLAFSIEDGEDEATLSVDQVGSVQDDYYTIKFEDICGISEANPSASGAAGGPGQPAYTFTTDSMWIAAFNGSPADENSGAAFVVGDECTSVGEFEVSENRGYPHPPCPTASSGALLANRYILCGDGSSDSSTTPVIIEVCKGGELGIMDICIPCLDCNHYNFVAELLARIKVFYDYVESLSTDEDTATIPVHPDGGIRENFSGVLQQLLSSQRYWDYLVHKSTVKFAAQGQGQSISAAGYYRNISNGPAPPDGTSDLLFVMTFEWFRDGDPWNGVDTDLVDVRDLNRTDRPSAAVSSVSFPNSSTLRVELTHPTLACGGEAYADIAVLIKDTALFDDGADYRVRCILEVSITHLIPSGEEERIVFVHFVPPETAEGGSS